MRHSAKSKRSPARTPRPTSLPPSLFVCDVEWIHPSQERSSWRSAWPEPRAVGYKARHRLRWAADLFVRYINWWPQLSVGVLLCTLLFIQHRSVAETELFNTGMIHPWGAYRPGPYLRAYKVLPYQTPDTEREVASLVNHLKVNSDGLGSVVGAIEFGSDRSVYYMPIEKEELINPEITEHSGDRMQFGNNIGGTVYTIWGYTCVTVSYETLDTRASAKPRRQKRLCLDDGGVIQGFLAL
jgi:hypothetical protein